MWRKILLIVALLVTSLPVASQALEAVAGPSCTPSSTRLCLLSGRFAVEVDWQETNGRAGLGNVFLAGSESTGYFWYSRPIHIELYVTMFQAFSGFWVIAAPTSDASFSLRVTDTMTGAMKVYFSDFGERAVIIDTAAFPADPPPEAGEIPDGEGADTTDGARRHQQPTNPAITGELCLAGPSTLCLVDDRFAVEVFWEDNQGGNGQALAQPALTSHAGTFAFFDPNNIDLLVKMVERCDFFEFSFGGTSDLAYTITVTDTLTNSVKEYLSPLNTLSSAGDTEAFVNQPLCIFADDLEAGDLFEWSSLTGG